MLTSTDHEICKLLTELLGRGAILRFLVRKGRREVAICDRHSIASANSLKIYVECGDDDSGNDDLALSLQKRKNEIFEMFPNVKFFQTIYGKTPLVPCVRKDSGAT